MKGDFTRDTFSKLNHFTRVLMQQGRVQLDADWNEQVSILLHYWRSLAAHLIGPHGTPAQPDGMADGFKIETTFEGNALQNDFAIHDGCYYVNGILGENEASRKYSAQDDYPPSPNSPLANGKNYLIYLEVWERHLSYLEAENGAGHDLSFREVALGGPDTATRAKVVWQVKATNEMPDGNRSIPTSLPAGFNSWRAWVNNNWSAWREKWQPTQRGHLKAKARENSETDTNPCVTPPEAKYRGMENQLYRVEIQYGSDGSGPATFKWSRENGSVVFPIHKVNDKVVTLEHLGRDERLSLKVGDWVEIVDDDYVLHGRAELLLQVDNIDPITRQITLKDTPASTVGQDVMKHPLLRRWDHQIDDPSKLRDGTIIIAEGTWLDLEDGVQIQFQTPGNNGQNHYRTGDYWLIPARTATGNVEWPLDATQAPLPLRPHGVHHYYAPLAILAVDPNGNVSVATNQGDLRYKFGPLAQPI